MRKTQKVFSLLLSMVLALALCVPAFASEVSSESERTANGSKVIVPLNPDEIVDFTEVLSAMPTIDLGSPDMAEYDNSPNIQTRASGFLFSMTAKEVYDLLTTGSNISIVAAVYRTARSRMRASKLAGAIIIPPLAPIKRMCMISLVRELFRCLSTPSILLQGNTSIGALSKMI